MNRIVRDLRLVGYLMLTILVGVARWMRSNVGLVALLGCAYIGLVMGGTSGFVASFGLYVLSCFLALVAFVAFIITQDHKRANRVATVALFAMFTLAPFLTAAYFAHR